MSMSMAVALFSPPSTPFPSNLHLTLRPTPILTPKRPLQLLLSTPKALPENEAGVSVSAAAVEDPKPQLKVSELTESAEGSAGLNGAPTALEVNAVSTFQDPKWVAGTWDLQQFKKDGKIDWDAVIDAEARRRKWLENIPESTSNSDPVVFDTSIVPWWAWMKRFHLPEAELLNGRAAMIGFFMAYLVDSLTGVGLVDQMSNFFCKTLLFVAVVGVLLIRKNDDVENLKKLIEETTFYDKQWQATWQDDTSGSSKND